MPAPSSPRPPRGARARHQDRARHQGRRARAPLAFLRLAESSTPGSCAAWSTRPASGRRSTRPADLRTAIPSSRPPGSRSRSRPMNRSPTADLVGLVERVGRRRLGICLDPANIVAGLELPRIVERCAALTATCTSRTSPSPARPAGSASPTAARRWARACTTTPTCSRTCAPERGINEIVEHWLPWQGDPETTVRTEREWTRTHWTT